MNQRTSPPRVHPPGPAEAGLCSSLDRNGRKEECPRAVWRTRLPGVDHGSGGIARTGDTRGFAPARGASPGPLTARSTAGIIMYTN